MPGLGRHASDPLLHGREAGALGSPPLPRVDLARKPERGAAPRVPGEDVRAADAEPAGRGKDPGGNERIGFIAKTSISREEFGLKWNQLLEAGGVLDGDKVDIQLDVQAVSAAREVAA